MWSLPRTTKPGWPWCSPASATSATHDPDHQVTAILLDGEAVAARVRAEVTDRVARLRGEGISVGLGTVLVGEDGPSERYVAMKHEDCAKVGMISVGEHLPVSATQAEVNEAIVRFNADPAVNAYLVQLPLP